MTVSVKVLLALSIALLLLVAVAWLTARGSIKLNEPSATRYPVRGFDVSHHQGAIDWEQLAKSGARFVFIKASEGRDHRDREFLGNWQGAAEVGLARSAYHFFSFCVDGAEQARNFLAAVPYAESELPLAVDLEYTGNCLDPPEEALIQDELAAFLTALEHTTGRRPIVYVAGGATRLLRDRFSGYPLWIRNLWLWPLRTDWAFWQYSQTGRVAGVKGNIDLNVFNGDEQQFTMLLSADAGSVAQSR